MLDWLVGWLVGFYYMSTLVGLFYTEVSLTTISPMIDGTKMFLHNDFKQLNWLVFMTCQPLGYSMPKMFLFCLFFIGYGHCLCISGDTFIGN